MKSVDTKNLAQVLFEITDDKTSEEGNIALREFASYLAKKNLLLHINAIISDYEDLYNKKNNIIEATVTLTSRLTEKTKLELSEALKKKYKASEVHMTEKIDTRILGGMKIKIGDEVFDSSLSHALYQLETQLLK